MVVCISATEVLGYKH